MLHDEPRPPRSLNPSLPRNLDTVCLKAMAREPQQRYATAGAFADDLRRFLDGQAVQARRPRVRERVGRSARRHRAAVWGLAGCLLSLCVGVVLALTLLRPKPLVEADGEPPLPADLALVPSDAYGFLAIDLASLRTSRTGRELGRQAVQQLGALLLSSEEALGLERSKSSGWYCFCGGRRMRVPCPSRW